ncbi:hypothetical protein F4778DRAFT_743228 [Xylariomycetidae sp. FL2044]|nr:hypothetical protein F4778DRAFT_743228 [Xylariomycetidae sp. FL2044]
MDHFNYSREVDLCLSRIHELRLPHPSIPLLRSFVLEALNPPVAAAYVDDRLSKDEAVPLVSDWTYIVTSMTQNGRPPPMPNSSTQDAITRREGGKCCVTGKKGSIWDPLVVAPILPIPTGWDTEKPQVLDMLGAFFGRPYRDWWLSYVKDPESLSPYHNHWLVRKSTALALARGSVRLDRRMPSFVEYKLSPVLIGPEQPIEVDGLYPLLGDHSRRGLETIDARFVGTHARLCKSNRLLRLSRECASERSHQDTGLGSQLLGPLSTYRPMNMVLATLRSIVVRIFLPIWLLFPMQIRVAGYDKLRQVGVSLYGRDSGGADVQRLPFGLYLKYNRAFDQCRNEFTALRMVHQHTSVPVPTALDVVRRQGDAKDSFYHITNGLILMTRVPGVPISNCQEAISDADYERISHQLKDIMSQVRDIPKTVNPAMAICNTLGEAIRDTRIRGEKPMGPFKDEASFSQILRFGDEPGRRGHKIMFTHADLNARNILVSQVLERDGSSRWSVTGIVDWENSGYYPEYWDLTKSMFERFRWPLRHNEMMKGVFAEFADYSRELDVEIRAFESGDGV